MPKTHDQKRTASDALDKMSLAATDTQNLIDHLSDLRSQLMKALTIFIVFFILVLGSIPLWFPLILKGNQLIVLSPLEIISFYMTISLSLAFGLSLPFLTHFAWQFIEPGLNERENRFFSLYSPVIFLLFIGGVGFGYFVLHPISYRFLTSIGSVHFEVMISAQEYVRFLLFSTLPIGLMFELPLVALFLAAIGFLKVDTMKQIRKWSYLILALLSALITPPDFMSQLIVLIPMIILYEVSLRLVAWMEKRKAPPSYEDPLS